MARRSAQNPRYQKGAEVGKTRRSAASAKPKRAVGDTAASASSSGKGKKKSRPSLLAPVPVSPEFRRWRKIWMIVLASAVVLSLVAWWQRDTMPGAIALAGAYGCIFVSLYIDFAKMRPMRKKAIAEDQAAKAAGGKSAGGTTKKTSTASDKDA